MLACAMASCACAVATSSPDTVPRSCCAWVRSTNFWRVPDRAVGDGELLVERLQGEVGRGDAGHQTCHHVLLGVLRRAAAAARAASVARRYFPQKSSS